MTKDPFADLPFNVEEPPDDAAFLIEVGDPALPPSARNSPEAQAAKLEMLRGLMGDRAEAAAAPRRPAPSPAEPAAEPASGPESGPMDESVH